MTKKPTKKTAKKATTKKATKKAANKRQLPNSRKKEHVAILVRLNPSTKQWIDDTAQHHGLSRDGFCRMMFETARATWEARDEDAQMSMFDEIQSNLEELVNRAVREAIANTPRNQIEASFGTRKKKP